MRILLVAVMIAASWSPAAAGSKSSTEATDPDKRICRTIRSTGSRLGGVRVCKTSAEWAEVRRLAEEETKRLQGQVGRDACAGSSGARC